MKGTLRAYQHERRHIAERGRLLWLCCENGLVGHTRRLQSLLFVERNRNKQLRHNILRIQYMRFLETTQIQRRYEQDIPEMLQSLRHIAPCVTEQVRSSNVPAQSPNPHRMPARAESQLFQIRSCEV